MGRALYRKYRSKTLSEIVGQEHITTSLGNALKTGKISHAYLFTGPRGTGKTSIARILAHEVNGLPYADDSIHMDIIEIDAASNRRIDEIRELRERVHTAPTSAKYKVYIIDEVHMLTKEAFNALLKTLEEPPAHVIFILATTEAHKLPETIVSRTQRYSFKPVETAKVMAHLRYIANQEKITIDDDALELVATAGGGSFRDSISLLDQARNASDAVTIDDVRHTLGIAPDEVISGLLQALDTHSVAETLDSLSTLRQAGYQSGQLAKQLIQHLRTKVVGGDYSHDTVNLISSLLEVPQAHDLDTKLEVILVSHSLGNQPVPKITPTEPAMIATPVAKHEPKVSSLPEQPVINKQPQAKPATGVPEPAEARQTNPEDDSLWSQVVQEIKQRHNTLYSMARMAIPEVNDSKIILYFEFPFHQKRLNEAKNKQVIIDIIKELTGKDVILECVVKKGGEQPNSHAKNLVSSGKTDAKSTLETISDIFGDAEVLDS